MPRDAETIEEGSRIDTFVYDFFVLDKLIFAASR